MLHQTLAISADLAQFSSGEQAILLKISSAKLELNVWLLPAEIHRLGTLSERAPELKSPRLGQSVGQSVHWSRDEHGRYYLLVGEDDETWDIGVALDAVEFEAILHAVKQPIR